MRAAAWTGGRHTSVALIGGALQPERFCPQPVPAPPSRIERYMDARRGFGFSSDAAYVRKLIRLGNWAYGGWIPVTPREQRYLRLRDRLLLGARAHRYLCRRRNLSGGVSIEDDWPRGPTSSCG